MPKATKLVFEIITTDEWDQAGIEDVANEFAQRYAGNLNIASACLVSHQTIEEPADEDDPYFVTPDLRKVARDALNNNEVDDDFIREALEIWDCFGIEDMNEELAKLLAVDPPDQVGDTDSDIHRGISRLQVAIAVETYRLAEIAKILDKEYGIQSDTAI